MQCIAQDELYFSLHYYAFLLSGETSRHRLTAIDKNVKSCYSGIDEKVPSNHVIS